MKIITEEMRFRQRLCEYALKYGVKKPVCIQTTKKV